MTLRGKVALVTGAGRRVGRVIALALADEGMRVAVHYHASAVDAEQTVGLVVAKGCEARALAANLADATASGPLVAAVVSQFGRLDLLVNSAASMTKTPFGSITPAQFDEIMALNLRAPLFVSQAAAPALAAQQGSIVNIGDHMGEEPWPGFLVHGVAKAGVVALTRHLAATLAPHVRVNAVVPGAVLAPVGWAGKPKDDFVRTTPLKRLGTADDVAAAVVYLATATYVTGEVIHVDGGRHVRR